MPGNSAKTLNVGICWLCAVILLALSGCSDLNQSFEFDSPSENSEAQGISAPALSVSEKIGEPLKASRSASFLSATFANRQNDFSYASAFLGELMSDPDFRASEDLLQQEVLLHIMNGDFHQAFKSNAQLLQKRPDDDMANMLFALELLKSERYAGALDQWSRTGNDYIGRAIKPIAIAWTWAGLKEEDEALNSLSQLDEIEGFQNFAAINRILIQDSIREGQSQEGVEEFFKVISEIQPINQRLVILSTQYFQNHNQQPLADKVIEKFKRENQDTLNTALIRELLSTPISPSPPLNPEKGLAEAFYDIALIFQAENRPRQSLYYAQLARYLAPESPFVTLLVADLYTELESYEAALNLLTQESLFPQSFRWLVDFRRANTLYLAGKNEEAIALFKDLDTRDPTRTPAMMAVGEIYQKQKDYAKAVTAFSALIDRLQNQPDPKDWQLYYMRGTSYERLGNWPLAEADLKQAVALNPNDAYALNYLGYSWIDRGENIERAKEYVKRAAQLQPGNGYIIDSLGWALYKLGEYEQALPFLERAVQLESNDPVLLDHLGDVYYKLGRTIEARYMWKQALDFKPEADLKEQILQKMRTDG